MILREVSMQIKLMSRDGRPKAAIARQFGVSRQTVYNHLKRSGSFPKDHAPRRSKLDGRYLAAGLPVSRLLRTDRGDDEDGTFEWKGGSVSGCSDGRGDDDVEIVIARGQAIRLEYVRPPAGC